MDLDDFCIVLKNRRNEAKNKNPRLCGDLLLSD